MRWKPETAGVEVEGQAAVTGVEESLAGRVSADLQARGIPAASAEALSPLVAGQLEGQGAAAYGPTLDGVAIAHRAQRDVTEDLARSGGELQEIERLMSSFAGELAKLDEVLEVLAAYLRRMRTASPPPATRLLH